MLDAEGLEPDTLAVREPSMDDVFLKLTGATPRRRTRTNR